MSDKNSSPDSSQSSEVSPSGAALLLAQPTWVKALMLAALLLTLVGGGAWAYGRLVASPAVTVTPVDDGDRPQATDEPSQTPSRDAESPASTDSFITIQPKQFGGTQTNTSMQSLPSDGVTDQEASAQEASASGDAQPRLRDRAGAMFDDYAPAAFRLGMVFFVGFAMGMAARKFIAILITLIGFLFLGIFGLQYAGFIAVDWSRISEFDWVLEQAWLQVNDFKNFVTGALPATGMATAGLVAGFRAG